MKKKYGGLRLVDLEATKTNSLCICIFKAMQPCESNHHFMLRFRLAILNPQRRSWGFGLDWFTSKQHVGFTIPRCGDILVTWKIMVKGIYQLSPHIFMELLHFNV